jgi:peptidoglycan/xylan/chitin deacetylase (PgdA/CDA1 family)
MKRQAKILVERAISAVVPLAWRMSRAPRLLVLMYHRVLPANHPDRAFEQPGMFVSPESLDMHLSVLRRHFELVHLDDWVKAAANDATLPRMACAITFDDGWRDNFDHAFPVLRRHRAPASIFLVSTLTGTDAEFWPNRLARVLLATPIQADLTGPLAPLLSPLLAQARSQGRWTRELIDQAIVAAKQVDESTIHAAIDAASGVASVAPVRSVMNESEVREMADSGLVRFGSHTRTHYRFRGPTSPQVLQLEIGDSAAEVAAIARRPADLFCYPNGDNTTEAVAEVRRHYLAAVTTEKGWHERGADPFRMRRVGVHEDISASPSGFVARISGWM